MDEMRKLGTQPGGDNRDFPRIDNPFPPNCKQAAEDTGGASPQTQVMGKLVITKPGAKACEQQEHYVVPAGHIFAMGDNRFNSNDSRVWGSVPVDNIKGKALFIWLSYRDLSLVHPLDDIAKQIRWNRIGSFVH
jgi:hypothetical protein